MNWTPENTALLVKLWNEGNGATTIYRQMPFDCTRNAVLGKIARLRGQGMALRLNTVETSRQNAFLSSRKAKAKKPSAQPIVLKREVVTMPSVIESVSPRPWTERQSGQCAYLISRTHACCNPAIGDTRMSSSYCAGHYEVMIDRDGMKRVRAKRGVNTRGDAIRRVSTALTTRWDEGREG